MIFFRANTNIFTFYTEHAGEVTLRTLLTVHDAPLGRRVPDWCVTRLPPLHHTPPHPQASPSLRPPLILMVMWRSTLCRSPPADDWICYWIMRAGSFRYSIYVSVLQNIQFIENTQNSFLFRIWYAHRFQVIAELDFGLHPKTNKWLNFAHAFCRC
jgi:hypothetical protein